MFDVTHLLLDPGWPPWQGLIRDRELIHLVAGMFGDVFAPVATLFNLVEERRAEGVLRLLNSFNLRGEVGDCIADEVGVVGRPCPARIEMNKGCFPTW